MTVASWVTLAAGAKKPPPPPAPVPRTGHTQCWDAAGGLIPCADIGQDGDVQAGVAWPIPRFTDRGNGTVRDNLTGLIWLKNGTCDALSPRLNLLNTWQEALDAANALASGESGLTEALSS
jgi:hypothetical protein